MLSKIYKLNKRQEGMTLLEVLLSLALLALLATCVLAIFTPPAFWIKEARDETTAVNYAAAILEELRDKRDNIRIGNILSPQALNLSQAYKPAQPADINAHLNIGLKSGYTNLYEVTVTVSWTEGSTPREIKVNTLMRKF